MPPTLCSPCSPLPSLPDGVRPVPLYALLTVQAQDKSYIDVADDSLIRVATEYYDHRGTPLRRLQAFYYHGRVYANAGHRHEAMTAYTRAKDFVPSPEVAKVWPSSINSARSS